MKLIYTGESIREAEKPYVQAPDYNGYLMQRAADARLDLRPLSAEDSSA